MIHILFWIYDLYLWLRESAWQLNDIVIARRPPDASDDVPMPLFDVILCYTIKVLIWLARLTRFISLTSVRFFYPVLYDEYCHRGFF